MLEDITLKSNSSAHVKLTLRFLKYMAMCIDVLVKFQTSHGQCYRIGRINVYKNKYNGLIFKYQAIINIKHCSSNSSSSV